MLARSLAPTLAMAAALAVVGSLRADEGMWTFDAFPTHLIAERYGVTLDAALLEHVRRSTVRLAGCTASFVSGEGLLLTNHHCVESCLAQNSTRTESRIETGFTATNRRAELRCGAQVAEVLVAAQDVTADVAAALRGLDDRAANERRRATLTDLEQRCENASQTSDKPLKCQAVTLYDGGQYWLYRYQRYTDVRLVFAPEASIAAFGGDPDNFQFPRWCLDFALLRAYEDGAPAATPEHLRIDFDGPEAGELVLVSGHPGGTDRQLTVAELRALRDRQLPQALLRSAELRGRYLQFAKQSAAADRIVRDDLNGLENGIKVQRKELDALLDDSLLAAKRDAEAQLQAAVARDTELAAAVGDPWGRIETALATEAGRWQRYLQLEQAAGFNSRLFRYARLLVRAAAERSKPNADRLRAYTDAALSRLEQQLRAPIPIYDELERLTLSFSLERMREWLGPDDPLVRGLLSSDSPDTLAARLVGGSKLDDPAARLQLWNGGQAAIDASDDAMIVLARSFESEARALRQWHEDEVEAVLDSAHEQIARARFAIFGTSVAPDATFTLRLNFGAVQGWDENGATVAPFTTLERLFERATGAAPFVLPERWLAARPLLNSATRFNLATNNDIVGGNSGSPLVDATGAIVGLIFDGNIHSISGSYWFNPAKNRAVAVHPAIIRTALETVYRSQFLLDELGTSH